MIGIAPAPSADLRGTPHNLARQGAASDIDAEELCVFCHTPTAAGAPATPLWQRGLERSFAFRMYDDVGGAATGRVGSHSVVCLSCHDATQASSVTLAFRTRLDPHRDHPAGVPYRGPLDGAPQHGLDYRPASRGLVDGRQAWWVSRRALGAPRSREDLPLFLPDPDALGAVPLIECGTCHDPHSSAPRFLRIANTGSQLCLSCHDK